MAANLHQNDYSLSAENYYVTKLPTKMWGQKIYIFTLEIINVFACSECKNLILHILQFW